MSRRVLTEETYQRMMRVVERVEGDLPPRRNTANFDGNGRPRASAADPLGQYQYMGHVMVSQNQDGWDWPGRAHALL